MLVLVSGGKGGKAPFVNGTYAQREGEINGAPIFQQVLRAVAF